MPLEVPARLPIARYVILIAGFWTCTIAASLVWNGRQAKATLLKVAIAEANAAIEKDFAYRSWAARHGGLYVPITPETPPNPYLAHVPHRDVRTDDGRQLTLVNPAYMIRQVAEAGRGTLRHAGHLTSLKPLRPENAPDAWEAEALSAFERGTSMVSAVVTMDGAPYLRVMRRFATEEACLRCHASQGYKIGDVRGGLSISTPLARIDQLEATQTRALFACHGLIWLMGMVALAIGTRRFSRRVREHEAAQQAVVDTTARLEQSDRSLRDAQRLARIGSWDLDVAAGIGRWSDETYRILELDPATTKPGAEAFLDVVHPADRDLVRATYRAALDRSGPYDLVHRLLMKDHRIKFVHGQGEAVIDEAGRAVRLVGTIQDVTESRRLEEQFRQVQKMEAVGRLAGGVAHDFNNIVTVVQSFARFLVDSFAPDDPRRADAEEIIKASDRAAGLTRQLLAFSRRTVTEPTVVDLNGVVAELGKMIRRVVGEDVEIVVHTSPALWRIRIDVTHVEQVITNLVVNARDAMKRGGRLTIETSNVEIRDDETAGGDGAAGRYVRLAVSDTGEGMSPEVREHAFEPFFTTKKDGGTGLGLATVYGIVKQAGGFIRLCSEPGQGTTFQIFLPRHDPALGAVETGAAPAVAVHGLDGRAVLLVEDEAPLRSAVQRILETRGVAVIEAGTGEQALALASRTGRRIDLVVTDMVMPRMSGPELAAALRKVRPAIEVLFMSGYTEEAMQRRAVLVERSRFIAKPFAPEDLVRKISELLPAA